MSDTEITSVEELIDAMAAAISPHAFGKNGSEREKDFSRAAALRAMRVCVPVVLEEAAAVVWAPDDASRACASLIRSLKDQFR